MSDSDWDDDFDLDNGKDNASNVNVVLLSGVAANPEEEENWDDDFDLDESVSTTASRKGIC